MAVNDEYTMRLARVKANQGRTVIMVGVDESFVYERARPGQKGRICDQEKRASSGSLIWAFLLGLLGAALGFYARFHLMSGTPALDDPDLELALSGAAGLCITFALSQLVRMTSGAHKVMQGAGVFVMIGAFHNLFFWAPGPMTQIFSANYVQQSSLAVLPNTFQFRGQFYTLGGPIPSGSAAQAAAGAPTDCREAVTRIEVTGARRKDASQSRDVVSCR